MAMGDLDGPAGGGGPDRVSILYYGPIVLPQRRPGPLDWLEDKLYTGLLFVAVALLPYELLGKTLTPS
jgi:hypothetical protein